MVDIFLLRWSALYEDEILPYGHTHLYTCSANKIVLSYTCNMNRAGYQAILNMLK